MLLLPLLYECSVTTVLLSGANERRHYQRIGPSLPLPENNRWTKSIHGHMLDFCGCYNFGEIIKTVATRRDILCDVVTSLCEGLPTWWRRHTQVCRGPTSPNSRRRAHFSPVSKMWRWRSLAVLLSSQLGQLSLASFRIPSARLAGIKAGMLGLPLPGGRWHCVIPYDMWVSVAVRLVASCYRPTPFTLF